MYLGLAFSPASADDAAQDTILRGKIIAQQNVGSFEKCQSVCSSTKDCTGFNFFPGGELNEDGKETGNDCTIISGETEADAQKNTISCRMPCGKLPDQPAKGGQPGPSPFDATNSGAETKNGVDTGPIVSCNSPQVTDEMRSPITITSVTSTRYNGQFFSHVQVGDRVTVHGSGLSGAQITLKSLLSGATVITPDPNAPITIPAVVENQSDSRLEFLVPDVPGIQDIGANEVRLVPVFTKLCAAGASSVALAIQPIPSAAQALISVENPHVRSGYLQGTLKGKVLIHGAGFDAHALGGGQVARGYFGLGTPGSATNRYFSVANLNNTYVELWLPDDCDQEGELFLEFHPYAGGSGQFVNRNPPLIVACAKELPQGHLVGSETSTMPGREFSIPQGSQTLTIRGRYLRFVKRVINRLNQQELAFSYTKSGPVPSAQETMTVSIPASPPGNAFGLCLFHDIQSEQTQYCREVEGIARVSN